MANPDYNESHDHLKEELKASSAELKDQLKNDLQDVTSQVQQVAGTALLVGGGLLVGYKLYKWMSNSGTPKEESSKPEEHTPRSSFRSSRLANVGNVVIQYAALYALNILRQKLIDYLENIELEEEGAHNEE